MKSSLTVYFIFIVSFSFVLSGQVEEMVSESQNQEIHGAVHFQWRSDSADSAMRNGLYGTAQLIFEDLLKSDYVLNDSNLAFELRLNYIQSLIELQKLSQAEEELKQVSLDMSSDRFQLYQFVVSYLRGFDGSKKQLKRELSDLLGAVDRSNLNERDHSWYFFFSSLNDQLNDSNKELLSNKIYDSKYGTSFFDSLFLRLSFNEEKPSSKELSDLKKKYKDSSGSKIAYYFAYDYAYLLALKGDDSAAITVINNELKQGEVVYSTLELDTLRLLKAMILGADSKSGRDLLLTLMQLSKNPIILERSFGLFVDFYDESYRSEYLKLIEGFIETQKNNALLAQFYMFKTRISLEQAEYALKSNKAGAMSEALNQLKTNAEYIIENYPGLESLPNVYELLVYVALKQSPSQYRLAADYLTRILELSEADFPRLNAMIGDCYFLNQDYEVAAQFYWNVLSNLSTFNLDSGWEADLWLRFVTAKSRSGDLEGVGTLIKQASLFERISKDSYWSIEWNLIIGLKNQGEYSLATERLEDLFLISKPQAVSSELRVRFQWMYLHLKYLLGISDRQSIESANLLLERLDEMDDLIFSEEELRAFSSQVMLLKGRFLMGYGNETEGLEVLDALQGTYRDTLASELSFIIIADYYSQKGLFDLAESYLLKLANQYPDSTYAPEALLEAALNAEKREPGSYVQAIRFLNELITNYEESPLVYFALRHQGDLLRKASDFSSALKVYDNLIQKYPDHPNRYLVELSRVDSLLALSSGGSTDEFDEILAELERLMDLPNLSASFQLEVGYKLAYVLKKLEYYERAVLVATSMIDRYPLIVEEASDVSSIGRYWFARTLFLVSDVLKQLNQVEDAKKLYRLLLEYDLPGNELAKQYLSELL